MESIFFVVFIVIVFFRISGVFGMVISEVWLFGFCFWAKGVGISGRIYCLFCFGVLIFMLAGM